MANYDAGSNGGSMRAKFPAVNAMGCSPRQFGADGANGRDKALGAIRPASVLARGKFGAKGRMGVGATRNPISSRGK